MGGECSHHFATLAPQKFHIDSASWFFAVELITAGHRIFQLSTDCSPKLKKNKGTLKIIEKLKNWLQLTKCLSSTWLHILSCFISFICSINYYVIWKGIITKQTDIYRYCVVDLRQNEIRAKSKDCCAWPHCHCVYSVVGVRECFFNSKWMRRFERYAEEIFFLCSLGAQQAEDPRLQWRKKRETMLSDYLTVAQSDLLVRLKFYPFETL